MYTYLIEHFNVLWTTPAFPKRLAFLHYLLSICIREICSFSKLFELKKKLRSFLSSETNERAGIVDFESSNPSLFWMFF